MTCTIVTRSALSRISYDNLLTYLEALEHEHLTRSPGIWAALDQRHHNYVILACGKHSLEMRLLVLFVYFGVSRAEVVGLDLPVGLGLSRNVTVGPSSKLSQRRVRLVFERRVRLSSCKKATGSRIA